MLLSEIYRSKKKEGMYLFLKKGASLEGLPEALQKQFGVAELAMTLALTAEKKLARADVEKVIDSINSQGYYLQMPPSLSDAEQYMIKIPNSKLGIQT
ncbi:hypothetical protein SAMN02745866_00631 [Alteromonadaceae bacterium Bs31]|nr:hypothetical protein SAMN02745866_00631 [Alteromonadaceae bacterium Bs31]